jgi:hypothetical protein
MNTVTFADARGSPGVDRIFEEAEGVALIRQPVKLVI